MHKLAGRLPLQDMITSVIADARMKVAAVEEKKEEKMNPFAKKKHEEKETPKKEEKEESKEKMSSAFDLSDPDELEKFASALEFVGDQLLTEKEADAKETGGESHQGGQVLATAVPPKGVQAYKKDHSQGHDIPMTTGKQSDPSQGKASTQVANDHAKAPGGPAYPAKGVLKVGGVDAVLAKMAFSVSEEGHRFDAEMAKIDGEAAAKKMELAQKHDGMGSATRIGSFGKALRGFTPGVVDPRHDEYVEKKHREGKNAYNIFGGMMTPSKHERNGSTLQYGNFNTKGKDKKSSAFEYVLGKMAESSQGGMTLDSKSGEGPKPPTDSAGGNDPRSALESNNAAINMKKVDGKKPQKRMLAEVLTEPAYSKAHDSKVHENLQNPSKGGVKIAEAKSLLRKVASEGCKCDGKGTCMYCKMKAAATDGKKKEKESMGGGAHSGMGMTSPSPMSSPPGMSGSI